MTPERLRRRVAASADRLAELIESDAPRPLALGEVRHLLAACRALYGDDPGLPAALEYFPAPHPQDSSRLAPEKQLGDEDAASD